MNTSMSAANARDKERNHLAELEEAVEKISNACLGDLNDDQIENLYQACIAQGAFNQHAELLYKRAVDHCEQRGFNIDEETTRFNHDLVMVYSGETFADGRCRYSFVANLQPYKAGNGRRWVCSETDAWEEHP
jgi:hypothetical protein